MHEFEAEAEDQSQLIYNDESSISERDPYENLNNAIAKIGFGTYHWKLFFLCGLGWAADNMWFQALAVILPQVKLEFKLESWMIGIGTTSAHMGAMIGAIVWGYLSDVIGRQPSFLMTLVLTTIGGYCASLARNLLALCISLSIMGVGIGGNLPIDGALFLEFVPREKQSLLTLMSVFWPFGQILTSIVGWCLIPSHSCSNQEFCDYESNLGWRYVLFTLSSLTLIMVIMRMTVLSFLESPKNLIARKKYREAVNVLQQLAKFNGRELDINEDEFKNEIHHPNNAVRDYSVLFKGGFGITTVLIIAIWILVAVGYTMFNAFLPEFLKLIGNDEKLPPDDVYRNYLIISTFGVPGSIVGMFSSDSHLGRRGTMALATFGTSISLFVFTIFTSSQGQLGASCMISFLQNIM